MGVGNFTLANAETVYIDDLHVHGYYNGGELDIDQTNLDYENLEETLVSLLPNSFYKVENESYGGGSIIAENNFYSIVLTHWVGYYALSVVIRDNDVRYDWGINPLAAHHHARLALRFFDKIHEIYPLRVPTSAWTSGMYQKKLAA